MEKDKLQEFAQKLFELLCEGSTVEIRDEKVVSGESVIREGFNIIVEVPDKELRGVLIGRKGQNVDKLKYLFNFMLHIKRFPYRASLFIKP